MAKFMTAARKFVQGEEGATMVEYGLMLACIAVVCIAAVTTLGANVKAMFTSSSTALVAPAG
jgi:pilus assembly protein Flp/PilA